MKNFFVKSTITIALVFTALFTFGGLHYAYAATSATTCSTDNGLDQVKDAFPAQYCTASSSIITVINILLGFLGIVSVFFIIIGGYQMVVSNGNEEGFTKGRQTVVYAVIGMLVAIFAYVIVTIVGKAVVSGSNAGNSNPPASSDSGSAGSHQADCNTINDAGSVTPLVTNSNGVATTTFAFNDQVKITLLSSNPDVSRCAAYMSTFIDYSAPDNHRIETPSAYGGVTTLNASNLSAQGGDVNLSWFIKNNLTKTNLSNSQGQVTITIVPAK